MAPARTLPVGTVTFLFTDIEGSTRMLNELGDDYPALLAEHHRILAEAVQAGGGVPVSTEGDSLFAAFASAPRAVQAAGEAQRRLAAQAWPRGARVRVRMGLHTGEGTLAGDTYVGIDVHRAARIAAAAHGGQVILSGTARALAGPSAAEAGRLRDLGEHRLKDLANPEHLYQLVIDGLPADFPAPRTLDATPGSLPPQLTSFIGREREVAAARHLLEGTRLLTLTGPGGTGKTRLSLRLAAEVAGEYPDGVFFVPLAPIDDPRLVASAVLRTLGVQDVGSRPPEARLAEHLAERNTLLVLDNFEQVTGASSLVADLLRAAPGLRVVVTSRSALHVSGEQESPVPPLGVPDLGHLPGLDVLSQYEAVALFIERATAVRPGFQVTNENAPAVAEICARLDGLPLAIELAAARTKLLPPEALLARLGSRLDMVAGMSRDLPARQQTLRGAIAWSHDLLDDPARCLFARFGIFVGGVSLEAAEAVCGPGLGIDVLEGLAGLVDQSLVRQDETSGEPRFSMLFTIREFALEQLAASGEAEATAARHGETFLALAERAAPELTGSRQKAWLDTLDRENDNLRAALASSLDRGAAETGLRLGAALWRFWQMRGLLNEGAGWLDRLLAMDHGSEHPVARARALEAAGGVAYWRGEMPVATAFYEECLALCRSIGRPEMVANALYNASFPRLVVREDVDGPEAYLEESLEIYRSVDDRPALGRVLWALANVEYFREEYVLARDLLLECVGMLREGEDPFSLAWALHTLGLTYRRLGEDRRAEAPWREALGLFADARDLSGIVLVLGDVSLVAIARGDLARAVRVAGAASQLGTGGGVDFGALVNQIENREPETIADLSDPVIASALRGGRALTVDAAVAEALEWMASLPVEA